MGSSTIRYKVRPDRAAENETLVKAVYEQLNRERPGELHYATFKLDDGVSFVHVASQTAESNPLGDIAAFARFQEGIGARCDEPPVVHELSEVGSFRFPGAA